MNSGTHFNNMMLLLTMLDSLDGIPCFQAPGVKKYLSILHYDGMPLNIGTFPRQENGETFFDGIIPPINLQKMKELYQGGNASLHKHISENCKWVSEVREFDLCDASGTIHVNVYTNFCHAGGDAESIKREIRDVLKSLSSCSACILSGNAETCTYTSLKEPCTRCKTIITTDNHPSCVSALCIHISSDQASAQRKAHMEMNEIAERDLNSPNYRHFGFGLLHFCKNCISSLRHYRLTDMSETFYVGLLSSVWASNTSESTQMKKTTPATVFSYRDAHSDEICFQTVSKDLEDALKETKSVVATLVPEQYKPTAVEAKTHSILGRPLYIASNANGDILWTDAEFEYVGMGNRHVPTKCIALGQWDSPGPPQKTTVTASNATFSHPSGIDVMIIKPGKCEVAFVSDKGNSTIRFIRGVETFHCDKFVGTLKLQHIPSNWKPEGLAVVDSKSIAVTAGKSVYMISLDDSLTTGQVIQLITDLQSPHGLCLLQEDTILVADEHCVKQIDLESKSVHIAAQGFKKAFDVAVSQNGTIGVTDVQAHQITLLKKTDCGFTLDTTIGTGTAGCVDGPATKAQLSEPTGLCFDLNTAIFCCFGGKHNGYIKLHTTIGFACQFMNKIRQVYDAIGFLPKKVQNHLAQTEQHHLSPYRDGVDKLVDSLCYMEHLISTRKEFLGISPAGPEGTVYHLTVKGFSETVSSLETHIQSLELMGMASTIDLLNLSAFVNESRKEHGFAKHKQTGQYRHPTKEQYCHSKGRHEIELIKKTCQCPHAYHTNNYSAYQPTHKSTLSSTDTVFQYRKWCEELHGGRSNLEGGANKEELKVARMLNTLTKSRPSQNIRDLYRYKCGYGPSVVFQKDALLQDGTCESHFPAFQQLMNDLQVQRNGNSGSTAPHERIPSSEYLLLPGDIAAINPGSNNGIPSADKWWLLQVNKAHPANRTGSGCHVFGFWLNEEAAHDNHDTAQGRHFHLLTPSVKVYFGSIIKDPDTKLPVVVPVEHLNTGWNNKSVTYVFTDEYCSKLELLSDNFRQGLDLSVINEESVDEETDEENEESNELHHEAELIDLNNRRRRVITNADGHVVQSYRDLTVMRPRRSSQRLQVLSSVDSLSEAERNSPEFE